MSLIIHFPLLCMLNVKVLGVRNIFSLSFLKMVFWKFYSSSDLRAKLVCRDPRLEYKTGLNTWWKTPKKVIYSKQNVHLILFLPLLLTLYPTCHVYSRFVVVNFIHLDSIPQNLIGASPCRVKFLTLVSWLLFHFPVSYLLKIALSKNFGDDTFF